MNEQNKEQKTLCPHTRTHSAKRNTALSTTNHSDKNRKGQSTCHDSDSLYQFCAVIVVIVYLLFYLMQLHEQVQ
jgi:Ca2+/H+ antiporter